MGFDLGSIISQIGRDKGIDKQVIIEAVESAMLSAARKHYGHNLNLETRYDNETGIIELLQFKVVVDQVIEDGTQISLEEARRDYDPDAMVGDEFGKRLDTDVLGRIAAQTAKQVIFQKLRDAERGVIYEEYKGSKGEIINGIVQRFERGNVYINLGRTEAILPKREQIGRERYRQNDRIRGMILDIDPSSRGPQIILSRSHPDFLSKLFMQEVPEINEGTIEIKGVAREPGERAKIAVYSSDSSIDPVGACVGIKGSRVHAIVQELRGEKIDIIPWTADEPTFVARALSPAIVTRVLVDEDEHTMEVHVADDQLSYAIGRRGNNVKLASKLTGWRIDVRSVSVADEESKRVREALEAIPGIQFTHAEILFQEGFRNAAEIADATIEELAELQGFTDEIAADVIEKAQQYVEKVGDQSSQIAVATSSDLEKLAISTELRSLLIEKGFNTIQLVIEANEGGQLLAYGVTEGQLTELSDALHSFFGGRKYTEARSN